MTDPLAAARGITFGTLCSLAIVLFILGAALAATGDEQAGALCMILACACTLLAIIAGGNNANAPH